ncbi:MAG TPA: RNA-binding protein [Puia sp.]|jgi:RNA recognition motif-containing protein|nr:RNA-binding protein [Puia sp.]
MQIRVGNLNVMTTSGQLAELFLPFGKVLSARIVCAGFGGRSQGMGLIQMESSNGREAIRRLHRLQFMNSFLDVDEVWG